MLWFSQSYIAGPQATRTPLMHLVESCRGQRADLVAQRHRGSQQQIAAAEVRQRNCLAAFVEEAEVGDAPVEQRAHCQLAITELAALDARSGRDRESRHDGVADHQQQP
jgi:hypothetical protein